MADHTSETNKIELSVVVPLLNEEQSLSKLALIVQDALSESYDFELIFVDDGSTDGSWQQIKELASNYSWIRGIQFLKNYGKSSALQTGFDESRGDIVATMDADLQDDPFEIPEMVEMVKTEYDLVSGWKKVRHDPVSKTIPSRFFNKITSWVTGIKLNDFNCGLKVYRKEVIDNIYLYGELHRYIPLLAKWEGYDKIGEKVVTHHPREYGKTKFGFSRFMHGFLDLVSLLFVNNYLQRPMHFFGSVGFLFLIIGGLINLYLAIDKIFYGANLGDRPLLLLGVMLMVLGAQFFSIGFLGELFFRNRKDHKKPNIKETI